MRVAGIPQPADPRGCYVCELPISGELDNHAVMLTDAEGRCVGFRGMHSKCVVEALPWHHEMATGLTAMKEPCLRCGEALNGGHGLGTKGPGSTTCYDGERGFFACHLAHTCAECGATESVHVPSHPFVSIESVTDWRPEVRSFQEHEAERLAAHDRRILAEQAAREAKMMQEAA